MSGGRRQYLKTEQELFYLICDFIKSSKIMGQVAPNLLTTMPGKAYIFVFWTLYISPPGKGTGTEVVQNRDGLYSEGQRQM